MEQHVNDSSLQTRLAATADPQLSSSFFSILPPEIRHMIYVEFWRHSSLHEDASEQTGDSSVKYHIINTATPKSGRTLRYTCSPCVVADQNSHDVRMERLEAAAQQNLEADTWARRIDTDWAVHWPCEELYKNTSRRPRSPFISTLLTCKLMYLECIESIYSNLTFVFTDIITAETFITLHPPATFRSIELCIRIPLFLPVLYYPAHFRSGPGPSLPNNLPIDAHNNPWARLCAALARATTLRRLDMWFDVKHHLRGWNEHLWERRFFKALAHDVRVEPREAFTVALPELGPRGKGKGTETAKNAYLEGECLDRAPFVVTRAPRPDYWEAHLARVRARTPFLTIGAGPAHGAA